jgi:hypothetical protein
MRKAKKKTPASDRLIVGADTSFLIALSRGEDGWHKQAVEWADYLERNNSTVFVSSIALSEYAVKGDITQLMMTGFFTPVVFDATDARITGELFSRWKKLVPKLAGSGDAAKNDIKIIASSIRVKASHVLTTDSDMPDVCKKLKLQLRTIDFKNFNQAE